MGRGEMGERGKEMGRGERGSGWIRMGRERHAAAKPKRRCRCLHRYPLDDMASDEPNRPLSFTRSRGLRTAGSHGANESSSPLPLHPPVTRPIIALIQWIFFANAP